jgi:hypothetical protein
MNKVIITVGLAALSAASIQAQDTSALTPSSQNTKDWSMAASLRGFFDDNYLTLPKSFPIVGPGGVVGTGHPLSSWGTEIIPSAAWNHTSEGTTASASYVYDFRWYENKSDTEQSHQLNLGGTHEFSQQYKLSVNNSFVIAQEPTVIDPAVVSEPLRVEGNNLRNTGTINFMDSITKELDLQLGYANTLYDYPQLANSVIGYPFAGPVYGIYPPEPSRSALLNRMEQLATVDLRWHVTPETTALLGYQFGTTWYTSGEYINYPYGGGSPYAVPGGVPAGVVFKGDRSDVRDSDSHYVFVGGDQMITQDLNGALRVGAEYIDYYNNVDDLGNKAPTSRVSPYVDASLTDQYQPGCSAQLGVKHVHNSTDVVGLSGDIAATGETSPVLDEESTAIYLSDNHRLTDKLTASVMGQVQLSTFVGGGPEYNGKMDQFLILQINFAYHWLPWFATEAGYNYTKLNSDLPDRAYTRDVMYVGLRATY